MSSDGPTDNGMIDKILDESKYIKINGLEVDIKKWSKMSTWTVMQAVCIFHGIDPMRGLQDKYLKPLSIYKNIMDSYDIMMSAASDYKIPHEGDPALFIDWAELVGITVTQEIKDAVLTEGIKRDVFELEKVSRRNDLLANLASETSRKLENHQIQGSPRVSNNNPQAFLVLMDTELRSVFYTQIRAILLDMSLEGRTRPTAKQIRKLLVDNPTIAPLFIGLTRLKEIEYAISEDRKRTATVSLNALQSFIYRVTDLIKET